MIILRSAEKTKKVIRIRASDKNVYVTRYIYNVYKLSQCFVCLLNYNSTYVSMIKDSHCTILSFTIYKIEYTIKYCFFDAKAVNFFIDLQANNNFIT